MSRALKVLKVTVIVFTVASAMVVWGCRLSAHKGTGFDVCFSVGVAPRVDSYAEHSNGKAKSVTTHTVDSTTCPCNLIGPSSCKPAATFSTYPRSKGHAVHLRLGSGQFGNHLFMYAAGIIVAGEKHLPLIVPDLVARLPRLQKANMSVLGGNVANGSIFVGGGPDAEGPGAPYYQHLHWAKLFVEQRHRLCYFMGMPGALKDQERPGPDDAVLYFRNYGRAPWGSVFDVYMGWAARLRAPPVIFFERILRQRKFSNVWVVGHPCQHKHPIVQYLVAHFGAKLHAGTDEQDFEFLSSAKTIILSPSTYGWWAAFFSSSSATVHYPIMPGRVPMRTWCGLMLRHTPEMQRRVIYHDWYTGRQYNGTPADVEAAYRVCMDYEKHAAYEAIDVPRANGKEERAAQIQQLQTDLLGRYYPQLKGVNTSQCKD